MRLGGEGSPDRTPLRTPCSLRPQPHVGKKENTKLTPHHISPRPLEPPPPLPPSASSASPLAPARTAKSLPLPSLSFHSTKIYRKMDMIVIYRESTPSSPAHTTAHDCRRPHCRAVRPAPPRPPSPPFLNTSPRHPVVGSGHRTSSTTRRHHPYMVTSVRPAASPAIPLGPPAKEALT
jgi:hypothetical protein